MSPQNKRLIMIQFCHFLLPNLLRLPFLPLLCSMLLCVAAPLCANNSALRYHSLADDFMNAPVTSFALTQDRQGFIWMANQLDGLQRFDGYQLSEFAFAQGSAAITPQHSISVSALQVDRHNRVWVGSWGQGLGMWSADRQHFSRWPAPKPLFTQQSSQVLTARAQQPTGNIQQIQALFADRKHRLWVGTTAGVYYLDSQDRPQQLNQHIHQRLSALRFWQISQGLDHSLWFATSEGLYQLSDDLTELKLWSSAPVAPFDTNPRTARSQNCIAGAGRCLVCHQRRFVFP